MFCDILKQLRREKSITQKQLSDIIGVETSSIGKYEGKSSVMPSIEILIRIANYFDVSVDYLIGRTDEKRPTIDGLSLEEQELVSLVKMMNKDGKAEMIRYSHFILMDERYKQERYSSEAM